MNETPQRPPQPEDASLGLPVETPPQGSNEPPDAPSPSVHDHMLHQVETKESRKLRAREVGTQSAWFGLGTFGMIGWSVAVPTVLGVLLGIWIDSKWPSRYSWTLMLLLTGLALGCLNAWMWVNSEREQIGHRDRKNGHDR